MELEQKTLRVGALAVACAILCRLIAGGLPDRLLEFFSRPETAAFILYLETGRVVKPMEIAQSPETTPSAEEPVPSTLPPATLPAKPVQSPISFSPEDAHTVTVGNVSGYSVDIDALLRKPLSWDLKTGEPTVLILHSHGSECYTEPALATENYRTEDSLYNVVSVGTELKGLLEAAGIGVIHDTALHDQPSYNSAYGNARASTEDILARYPSIRLVLDIHRDAAENSDGQQVAKTVTVHGQDVAQLMLVVGTDAGGLAHPNWEENMALAVKLHAQLEKTVSGICRPISFRTQRFNQDLSPGALIVEVGAAGNTRQEALRAAEYLAQAVIDLAKGTTADSTS